jgi:hypothetical protein
VSREVALSIIQSIAERSRRISELVTKRPGAPAVRLARKLAVPIGSDALGYTDPGTSMISSDEAKCSCKFVVSTFVQDRDGDVVMQLAPEGGIVLDNFRRNPVGFFNHQEWPLPIGLWENPDTKQITVERSEPRTVAEHFFDQHDGDAMFVFDKCNRGIIRSTSIGFMPLIAERIIGQDTPSRKDAPDAEFFWDGYLFKAIDLLEISIVGVGANQDALRLSLDRDKPSERIKRALEPYAAKLRGVFNGWTPLRAPAVVKRIGRANPVRWNKQLSTAFDVSEQQLEPSCVEYDWASKWIGVPVKKIFQVSRSIPSTRMGSFLTGLRNLLAKYELNDVRKITYGGEESPPIYEVIRLKHDLSDDFLIDGSAFYSAPQEKFIVRYEPGWGGIDVTVFCPLASKSFANDLLSEAWKWAKQNNFLKGEVFALSGEFLDRTAEGWDDVFLEEKNKSVVKRFVEKLNAEQDAFVPRGILLCGPPGCLHGETPIYDPVDGTTLSVRARERMGTPFHVWARDTNGQPVAAKAEAPWQYEPAEMLRLTFESGRTITVTKGHRFFAGQGIGQDDYARAEDLASALARGASPVALPSASLASECLPAFAVDPQRSTLERDLSTQMPGARRSTQTTGDSTGHYSEDSRPYDGRLLHETNAVRESLRCGVGARQHSHALSHGDGPEETRTNIRPPACGRRSSTDYAGQIELLPAVGCARPRLAASREQVSCSREQLSQRFQFQSQVDREGGSPLSCPPVDDPLYSVSFDSDYSQESGEGCWLSQLASSCTSTQSGPETSRQRSQQQPLCGPLSSVATAALREPRSRDGGEAIGPHGLSMNRASRQSLCETFQIGNLLEPVVKRVSSSCPLEYSGGSDDKYNSTDRLVKVEEIGVEPYFDFHVPGYENYWACGFFHHNTGKTLVSRIVRNVAKATFIWVSSRDFHNSGSFGGVSMAFELAKELAPSVLVMEDVDNWLHDTTIDLIKTEMDGVSRYKGLLTILTTNYPELLPNALIDRPGRFHDILAFELPNDEAKTAMMAKWLPGLSAAEAAAALARTEGYSGAHVYELAQFAKMLVASEGIDISAAVVKALDKIEEQRDLITSIQLEGSRYDARPRRRSATGRVKRLSVAVAMPQLSKSVAIKGFTLGCKKSGVDLKDSFSESDHPRGQPGNAGQFGPGGGGDSGGSKPKPEKPKPKPESGRKPLSGSSAADKPKGDASDHPGAAHGSKVFIKPTKNRVFNGEPVETKTTLTKQETGRVGEAVILAYLHDQGFKDARPMNAGATNFPIDMIEDHRPTEIKAGLASNGKDAQKWRLTFSKESAKEKELYEKMTPEERADWNHHKQKRIRQRKEKALKEIEAKTGKKAKPRTMTVIINPETKTADVYEFDGWHDIIRWNSPEAKAAYKGSVTYGHK